MKKLILLMLSFLILGTPCLAEYKPIPKELSKQYKKEITHLINTQFPVAIQETEMVWEEAHKMYLKVLKNKEFYMDYATSNYDTNIDIGEFNLLSKIITVTDKYVKIKEDTALTTDFTGALASFLSPYFKDNKIKTNKLNRLSILINKKYKEIEQEQQTLHRYIYPEEY